MSRKNKYTSKQKIKAYKEYISNTKGSVQIAKELGMSKYGDDMIRVSRTRTLPPSSFRFLLTMDILDIG